MELKASTARLQWFQAGFDLRDLSRAATAGPRSVELWLGAADRAEAVQMAAAREVRLAGRAEHTRRIAQRRPLAPLVPSVREALAPELAELADRPWAIVEGCLVQAIEDADIIAAEWLEVTGGDVTVAERSINRLHLWDALDDEEPGEEHDDLAAAAALARAWQRRLARVPGAERVVIELTSSADGPELTAFRWNVAARV
ncbi:MAG: hypothetical protein J7513_06325 [Solirubrobacteraceae bacterium]|nr:hypothetical protein [Solirubrobacteraceae bacterium]